MALTSFVRISIRVAAWVTPRFKEWKRRRHLNRNEGEAAFQKGNFSEAEKYLVVAAAEGEKRKQPLKTRLPILFQLAESRQKQKKFLEARQTIGAIMVMLRQSPEGQISPEYARCLDMLASMHKQSGNWADAQRLYGE